MEWFWTWARHTSSFFKSALESEEYRLAKD